MFGRGPILDDFVGERDNERWLDRRSHRAGLVFWHPVQTRLSCVARSSVQDPPSVEVSRCLVMIMGESRDSGLGLGLDALAVLCGVKKGLLCN